MIRAVSPSLWSKIRNQIVFKSRKLLCLALLPFTVHGTFVPPDYNLTGHQNVWGRRVALLKKNFSRSVEFIPTFHTKR